MSWSFNPFTGNLDLVGSGGGTVVFEGEVETFAELPETVGDPAVGASFLVRSSTGVWLVNRRQAGIWIRKNNTGVRATDWEYGGDYPVNSVNGQTGNVSLTAADVSAAWALAVSSQFISSNTLLSAGRNRRITLSAVNQTVNVDLPYSGNADGDVVTLVASSGLFTGSTLSIRTATGMSGGLPVTYATLATLTAPNQSFTFVSNGTATGWTLRAVDTHTHTASQITDFAQAAQDYTVVSTAQTLTVGAKVAANTTAGAFTLTLPASPANGDTVSILDYAGTFDTNNLTLGRNGSNIESLAENMDCNLEDAAFSLVYVGSTVGWKVIPYFGSKTNLDSAGPIGSTIPSTGAFTTLAATTLTGSSQIIGPQGADVGSVTSNAITLGAANTGFHVSGNQLTASKQGAAVWYANNSSRLVVAAGMTNGLAIEQTDAPINFGRNVELRTDGATGVLAQRLTTTPQSFRIYNTWTSTTNFERLNIAAQTGGSFIIGTEKGSAGGSARGLELRTDSVARINISATGGIGFFGAAAAAQPTAVADATDAASVITQLNALLSRMRTLGLIAT